MSGTKQQQHPRQAVAQHQLQQEDVRPPGNEQTALLRSALRQDEPLRGAETTSLDTPRSRLDSYERDEASLSASDDEEGATSSSTATRMQQQQHTSPASSGQPWGALQPAMLVAVPALALLAFLYRHMRKKQQHAEHTAAAAAAPAPAPAPQPEATLPMWASDFQLSPPSAAPGLPQPLQGLRFAVSEHIPIAGAITGCGVPAATAANPPAATPAAVVQQLLDLGADSIRQASVQPFNSSEPLGLNIHNPAAPRRAAGSGASGGAAAVAVGVADVAVGTDYLGSVRVPAACTGLCSYVSTAGTLQWQEPAGSSGTGGAAASPAGAAGQALESVGFIAREVGFLSSVAKALGQPGSANLKHDLTQVVVAEDLFGLCEPELGPGIGAVKRAILAWAGQEQAGSVQLLPFLSGGTSRWRELLTPEQLEQQREAPGGGVLLALAKAAETLHRADAWARYGAVLSSLGGGSSAEGQQQESEPEELAVARRAAEAGSRLGAQEVQLAQEVAAEVQDILRGAVRKDVIVVVPVLPSAPPLFDAHPQRLAYFTRCCQQFACIPALAGCPCITLPAAKTADGAPLSVMLFGLQRTDQRLLAVGEKLAPLILREADALWQQKQQQQQQQEKATAAASPGTRRGRRPGAKPQSSSSEAAVAAAPAAARKGGSNGGGAAAAAAAAAAAVPAAPLDPKRVERAEKAKARGNELFKAGKYMDATKEYTKAIQQHPENAVYYSNRAMAYLKAFHFELAEADCDKALGLAEADSDRVKALLRRGTARMHLYKTEGAAKDFAAVLAMEPNNRQAREELRALKQQQAELADAQRRAQQSAGAAANGGFHMPHGMMEMPHGMMGMMDNGMEGMEGTGQPGGAAGGVGGDAGFSPEEFAAMVAEGQVPMLLGPDGQPLQGPNGERVVVLPDGKAIMLGPDGSVTPVDVPLDYAAAGAGSGSVW